MDATSWEMGMLMMINATLIPQGRNLTATTKQAAKVNM
jgi:hypothetical protein